jgi:uncharacterized protein
MLTLGLALSLLIGVALGLLGGGGSTLTLPILTYILGMGIKEAMASSLIVVAVTSAVGAVAHARAGRVRWRTGLVFGSAGMVGAALGGRISGYLPGRVLLGIFVALMIAMGVAMLRERRAVVAPPRPSPVLHVLAQGVGVGLVTGTVGAGGGFLIVPALVLLGGLSMEAAVGTSLLVIVMQSCAGFVSRLGQVELNWSLTWWVTGAAVAGSFVGAALSGRLPAAVLRRGFGYFVLAIAALLITKAFL